MKTGTSSELEVPLRQLRLSALLEVSHAETEGSIQIFNEAEEFEVSKKSFFFQNGAKFELVPVPLPTSA